MAGPYDKFQESFEAFQTQLRQEVKEELQIFKMQVIQEIRNLATGAPFDPLVFRHELLQDIEKQFHQFKEELDAIPNLV